ncbi:unnamed protein product, partial [Mesorhabditis spiculigera]
MGCPLLLLLFLLVAADVQAQGEAVTCAINGPALYSAETGCYPGPISSDDQSPVKSLLFRTDYDGYQVNYVTDSYLKMWKNGYEASCGLKNAPKTGAVLPKLEREMDEVCDIAHPPWHPVYGCVEVEREMEHHDQGLVFFERVLFNGKYKSIRYACAQPSTAPYHVSFCDNGNMTGNKDPYIPTAPTTPNGNWPDSMGSVLHSPVSPGFFALFDAYKKSIEPLAMPSPTYVRDDNHQYPDDWRITIATAPTTTTTMTTEASHGTNPTRLVVTEPSWSDEGWVQSRVFVLCVVALFVLTVYFKNKKYEPPPPVSWLETSTPEDAQRPEDSQNPAKPPDTMVKSARSSVIV